MKMLAGLAGWSMLALAPSAACAETEGPVAAPPATPARGAADRTAPPTPRRALTQLHVLPPPDHAMTGTADGPLAAVGTALADHGIYLRALLVDELAANVSGGQGRGHGNSLALPFGADVDLDTLAGWRGASVHMSVNTSVGTSLAAEHTLNAVSFQTRYKAFHNSRLSALALDQQLFGKVVTITGGRVSALTFFNASPLYCNFQSNAVCFNPGVVPIQNQALSFFPYGTWGGRVKVSPSPRFYVQIGGFEANRALNPGDGFDFATRDDTGVMTALEVGFQSASPRAAHAYHIRLGGFRNSSAVTDPFRNVRGISRVQFKGPPLLHQNGQTGWYAMGDVVLARFGAEGRRSFTLFGGSIGAGEDYTAFKNQTLLGAIVTGPFAGRPDDTLGFVGSYLQLGRQEVAFLQASRQAAGGIDRVRRAEGLFELNYGVPIARGIRANPNIQYLLHPDNLGKPAAVHRSGDILAFGLRVSVEMGALLGLPVWH